ncbi:MAG: exo-alpha-sialidase [Gammaproteobacteria bacterium]|nr:exo-alpha-sialidase [Gammaproteobacteria bacterium]
MKLLSTKRIWHSQHHNAFTDLILFKNTYYVAFRTAETHHSINGFLQILSSCNGDDWEECATISLPDSDLRDPKFCLHPDGQLAIHTKQVKQLGERLQHHSLLFRSQDGKLWDQGQPVGEENIWMWRAKWFQGYCYSIGYTRDLTRLYRSTDGVCFDVHKEILFNQGFSNESDWVYLDDGTMVLLLRRDGKNDNTAMLGISCGDYTQWSWHDLQMQIGGPALLKLSDDCIIVAIRTYSESDAATELYRLDLEQKKLQHLLTLPSSGDCSYAGIIQHDDEVWVSYYSSHEDDSTDIYLAKLQL